MPDSAPPLRAPAVGDRSARRAIALAQARISYGIGFTLDVALLGLVVARRVVPVSDRYDAATLPELYVSLLVLGSFPALVGAVLAVEALAGREIRWGSVGLGLNVVFLLTAARLVGFLVANGFFDFVRAALRSVVEV